MPYKTELHLHSSEISSCGRIPAVEMVRAYSKSGYRTLVFTNHFYKGMFQLFKGETYEEIVSRFKKNWLAAREYGEQEGITVLFGIELRIPDSNNDYLIFGVTPEYLISHAEILELSLREIHELAEKDGFLVYQAHPFRNGMKIVNPAYLDGMEGYNGNARHDSRNDIAGKWAEKFLLPVTSGSDAHQAEDIARGGILTEEPVDTMDGLLRVLKNRQYTLIETE